MAEKLLNPAPLAVIMTWNMAEGVGDMPAIEATLDAMYDAGKGRPTVITLQESHLPAGHGALHQLLERKFPDWEIASFNIAHDPSLREAHGYITVMSPETSLRRVKRQTLPQAHPVYDLFVEKKQRGKKRGVLVTAVDIPHKDKRITLVVANAHIDVRGGWKHQKEQIKMVSETLHNTRAEEQAIAEEDREFVLAAHADWNIGDEEKIEAILTHLGDEFVEATRRGATASIPKSIAFFLDSTEIGIIRKIFDKDSLLRRGLRRVSHLGQRSLDHVYTSKTLRAGDWFEIDFGASDHKAVGLMVYETEQEVGNSGVDKD